MFVQTILASFTNRPGSPLDLCMARLLEVAKRPLDEAMNLTVDLNQVTHVVHIFI